eukprot:COSAG06_NODE_2128_length_7534_cov_2.020713_3_plen_132_part_00
MRQPRRYLRAAAELSSCSSAAQQATLAHRSCARSFGPSNIDDRKLGPEFLPWVLDTPRSCTHGRPDRLGLESDGWLGCECGTHAAARRMSCGRPGQCGLTAQVERRIIKWFVVRVLLGTFRLVGVLLVVAQ